MQRVQTTLGGSCAAGAKASVAGPAARMDVFRADLLRRTLAGKTVGQARDAAERLYPKLGWISRIAAELARHRSVAPRAGPAPRPQAPAQGRVGGHQAGRGGLDQLDDVGV